MFAKNLNLQCKIFSQNGKFGSNVFCIFTWSMYQIPLLGHKKSKWAVFCVDFWVLGYAYYSNVPELFCRSLNRQVKLRLALSGSVLEVGGFWWCKIWHPNFEWSDGCRNFLMKLPLICSGAYPTCSLEESLTYSTLSWPSTTNMNPGMEYKTMLNFSQQFKI